MEGTVVAPYTHPSSTWGGLVHWSTGPAGLRRRGGAGLPLTVATSLSLPRPLPRPLPHKARLQRATTAVHSHLNSQQSFREFQAVTGYSLRVHVCTSYINTSTFKTQPHQSPPCISNSQIMSAQLQYRSKVALLRQSSKTIYMCPLPYHRLSTEYPYNCL